ncbi:MAG TPA: M14 family zinc carboxypeptidase [Oligoflexia bacterium]|nr:M14 family zinc carboxypeptidase [Oligoflexia bacterium]HMR24434.1 M14 family zinc carboxypeptidase [Oligoflexia bacterium]
MWRWIQKISLFIIFIVHTGFASEALPEWDSFNPFFIQSSTKTFFATVNFDDGRNQLVYISLDSNSNIIFWGFAQKDENNTYSQVKGSPTYFIDPFALMEIRESVRNKRITYDLTIGRSLSHVREFELHSDYEHSAEFFSRLEHYLLFSLYQQIEYFIQHFLNQEYPQLIETIQLGTSYEKRPIYAYKIACPNSIANINLVWVSLAHARERSTVMSNLYSMLEFLHQLTVNPQQYCNTAVWFIPILNPDGFVYANTHNEVWRKNRRPVSNQTKNGETINGFGVDIDRNFFDPQCSQDFRFYNDQSYPDDDETFNNGNPTFSDDPNSDIYRGTENSEAETQALINLVANNHPKITFNNIVSLHSAIDNGGIFHLDDQDPRTIAEYIHQAINANEYNGYEPLILNELMPGMPELYMHNRGIPMLAIVLRRNYSTLCYNLTDPPLEQYIEDLNVTIQALFANIHYWQSVLQKKGQ